MDALRKQASKLREQVAKQQQAVIKQFSSSGYESSDVVVIDEVEMQRHHQLEKLYRATRSGKTGTKLSEDCCKYGAENNSDNILAKAASVYGDARKHVEKEHEELNRLLSTQVDFSYVVQVLDPLRQMINGVPLEDARHLAQRYSRMRQEAEAQREEIVRRQARVREAPTAEQVAKLHAAEAKMQELKANMAVLGKEAAAALAAVEAQQQRLTFQRLVAMVEGEKTFHLRVAAILGEIEAEMVSDRQKKESAPPVGISENGSEKTMYFLAEATHPFSAESEKELSFSKGDFVVVRKVCIKSANCCVLLSLSSRNLLD
ncbi:hypothetical protein JHK85_021607 [Glycine max]|nr:hypothetical protein JHK85_021607 [Glycine max]